MAKKGMNRKKKGGLKIVKPTVLANNVSPRPIAARNPRGRKAKLFRAPNSRHTSAVCALTDPFCPAAKNSRWPDGTVGNTMSTQIRGSTSFPTSASGTTGIAFNSAFPFGRLGAAAGTASTITFGATYDSYQLVSLFNTYGVEYRIVSFGVIVRCIGSATNAAGVVTLGTCGQAVPINTALTLGTEMYDEVALHAIQPGMEIAWIAQPRGPTAREFKSPSTATSAVNDWTNLVVEVSGAGNAQTLLLFEHYMNIEWTVVVNGAISTMARPNPPKSPVAETAVSKVHSSVGSLIEGGVSAVESTIQKHASAALASLMDDPLDSLASLFAMF